MINNKINRKISNTGEMKINLHNRLTITSRSILICLMMLIWGAGITQVDCDLGLACNDGIQVSLEDMCDVTITADMILENMDFMESDYLVTLTDFNGVELPSNVVDGSYVGQTLSVSVELIGCNNSCWGEITIEDKLPPMVTNCENAVIDCDDSREPGVIIPAPVFTDACDGIVQGSYVDVAVDQLCQNMFAEVITRTWTATDASGNTATCIQTISVNRADVMNTVFPMDFDGMNAFECGEITDTLDNGAPSPDVTGFPSGLDCPNIQYIFDDLIFPICGNSKKILRIWSVFDWCTGQDTMDQQVIKILDTMAPVCDSAGEILYETTTDPGLCTGAFTVPAPDVSDECSGYSYIVGYKPVDDSGDPFTDVIYSNATIDGDGIYTLYELPIDTSWIVYTITDDCGNVRQCYNRVVVVDDEAPTAICEGFTVITLDNLGHAELFAESIDDGSWDNCMIDRFEIKRNDSNCSRPQDEEFGELVEFCCDDTSVDYIMVTLRVYDKYDNFNDCRVRVKVQDKIPPEITCPSRVEIDCTEDKDDLSLTGMATAADACVVSVDYVDNLDSLNSCGIGFIIRTWIATDQQGLQSQCTQRIDVTTEFPFNEDAIDWPDPITLPGCKPIDADPDGPAGKPIIMADECKEIAIAYEDQSFFGADGKCVKIIRRWRVTDWCTFDPSNPFYYYHSQQIVLDNKVAPEFITDCIDRTAVATGCEGFIELSAVATDDCTPESDLKYRWEIDEDNDGDIDYQANGNNASGIYKAGLHKITFYAKDACGNEGECTYFFSILDDKAPTPICYGELVWVLDNHGQAEIWASDFDLKSTDGCSADENLHFAFNESGTATSLDFDCFNVPNGIAAEIPLKMYVFDESGNYSYCDVILILQDSPTADACQNDNTAQANIAGRILNETFEGLTEVEVELENMSVQDYLMNKTNDEGQYAFSNISYYDTYHVNPHKDDDITNGVSTLDLVFIQQYILGMRDIDSPYKLIAADVNGNNKISASDLIDLRKIILGIYDSFPNNTSWRFIPSEYEFEQGENTWEFPEDVKIDELLISEDDIDFVAIKTGDINGTATANSRGVTTRSRNYLTLNASTTISAGQSRLEVSSQDIQDLIGLQFTLDFGQDVAIRSIDGSSIEIQDFHINKQRINEGLLMLSWNEIEAVNITGGSLFTITFDGEVDPSLIQFTSEITAALAYDGSGTEYELSLNHIGNKLENSGFMLHQNQPNPFNEETMIRVTMPEDMSMDLTFYDISGKVISSRNVDLHKGANVIPVKKSELNLSGVVYYQLSNQVYSETKKMIILD
jgi:hypothetical protein